MKEEATAPALSLEDEEVERRYTSYLNRAHSTDLSEFDKLGVVYHSGKDKVKKKKKKKRPEILLLL